MASNASRTAAAANDLAVKTAGQPPVAAVVLAAGQGKRMRSGRPKPLHKLCGQIMLRFPLEALAAAGVARRAVVLGVGRAEVEAALAIEGLAPGLALAHQPAPLGTADAVRAARGALEGFEGDLLVLAGDAPCITSGTIERLLAEHRRAGADATVVTARAADPRGYGRIVRDGEGAIARIVEERDASPAERALDEVNSGLYAFRTAALWGALERVRPENEAGEYYLTDVVRILLAERRRVGTVAAAFAEVEGVNDRRQLADAAAVLRGRILDRLLREGGVTIVDPATTFIEAGVEIGADTVVEPFTVIRRGARIGAGCHVGPFAHVSDGAILEDGAEIGNFVEVKRTRVGSNAKAKHLAYLGDGEIGAGANIGAGTIFCNYDGKNKHRTTIGEKAFIGSGSLIVAPAEVGPGAVTGAGAVVTRGKKVPAGETWAGVPARPIKPKGKGEHAT